MKTDKQLKKELDILKRAIQQARDNGLKIDYASKKEITIYDGEDTAYVTLPFELAIFNHNFAKALWGDSWANFREGESGDSFSLQAPNWKGHLMNMVISVNPINYLGKNI